MDGYQGREKECVILSLVRSNPGHEVGFLAERRRLNVAVTRARRQVTVICDSETVGRDLFLRQFLDYLEEHGTLESASLHAEHLPEIVRPKDCSLFSVKDKEPTVDTSKGDKKPQKGSELKKAKKKTENVKAATNTAHVPSTKSIRPESTGTHVSKPEDIECLRTELRAQVDHFINGLDQVFHFSSELTAQQRRLVHEIAEELALLHESRGEGTARHIVLSKPAAKDIGSPQREVSGPSIVATADRSDDLLVCSRCNKSVSKPNMELHKLRCQIQPVPSRPAAAATSSTTSEKVKKKKSAPVKKLPSGSLKNADVEEDFDAVCAQFQTLGNVCNYERCKTKTAVLGADCVHCRSRFCLAHALAEIHGCGEAAKLAARQQLFR